MRSVSTLVTVDVLSVSIDELVAGHFVTGRKCLSMVQGRSVLRSVSLREGRLVLWWGRRQLVRHGRRKVEGRHSRRGSRQKGRAERNRRLLYHLHQVSRLIPKSRSSVPVSERDSTVVTLTYVIKVGYQKTMNDQAMTDLSLSVDDEVEVGVMDERVVLE